MLDNEPTDQQTTDQGVQEPAPPPAKKATRKRAAKKATPPTSDAAVETGSEDTPVKATRSRRSAKKTAASPPADTTATGSSSDTAGGTEAPPAPAKKATRKRASKKAAAQTPVEVPAADAAPEDEDESTAETPPTPGIAVLFQAPEVEAEPRRRRSASRPAGPPKGVDDVPTDQAEVPADARAADDAASEKDDDDGDEGRPRRRRRGGRGRRKRSESGDGDAPQSNGSDSSDDAESTSEGSDETTPADSTDEGQSGSGRRRRGRGSRSAEQASDGTAAEEQAASDDESSDDSEDETEGTSSSRRRRRRRRRGAGGDDSDSTPSPDDPPNTVVRVRQGRKAAAKDEVVGVKGSTRLEAKRQRRREGRESGRRRQVITESEFLSRREAVDRTMLVREHEGRTQIAVLEDGVLVEHYVARKAAASMIGNVYLGKVQNVLPSMEAAFIDIGKGRNAVLYAGEVNWDAAGMEGKPRRIELALKSGDPVLVQVSKDPVGSKGSRLTSQISLPGRYLVYVPNSSMTGISRKLPDTERARLKKILKAVVPDHAGVIVRTAAEGTSETELERDVVRLQKRWEDIEKRSKAANPPTMLHGEPDLTVRVIRDVFNEDFSSLVVTGDEAWSTVKDYVDEVAPDLSERLSHWDGDQDLFAAHRVDEQIAKALERKVHLPSGGSLVIDRTEAMTVVDVNTGKFIGAGGNLEETVTRNNLEAAEEIVRQLRLRDVGGIIVIDFIDMVLESNRDLVMRRLLECLGRDRTKHQVAEVTSLGLVQMTRKRVGQGLLEAFSEPCEYCQGRGVMLFDEPVEPKGGSDDGGTNGRGGRGGGNGRDQSAKKGPSEAQKVHEAARKAQEKAEQERGEQERGEQGKADRQEDEPDTRPASTPDQVPAEVPALVEVAPAGAEMAPVGPVLDGVSGTTGGATATEPTATRPRRRRRATAPSTTPAPAPPA